MASKPDFRLYLSYSRKDQKLLGPLIADLAKNNIRIFFDENIIEDGAKWQGQLTNALVEADGILALITPNSISSQYVMNELGMARTLSMDPKNPRLFLPVIYGDVSIPLFIQDIQVIFWRDNYNEVLTRIVNAVNSFENRRHESDTDRQNSEAIDSSTTTTTKTTKTDNTSRTTKKVKTNKTDKTTVTPDYWLLKLQPETWNIEQLEEGVKTFFSPYYYGEKRPEFRLFAKIKKGDIVLCLSLGNYQGIVSAMEVTDPVGKDKEQDETFKMVVKRLFKPPVPLKNFQDRLPNILPKLLKDEKPPELLFQLDEAIYNYILSSISSTEGNEKPSYQPFYLTEGDHESTTDQLDFQNDIDSFASVIALKKVNPPLAIGLFGNWGSGKSFFMEKLMEQILSLTHGIILMQTCGQA